MKLPLGYIKNYFNIKKQRSKSMKRFMGKIITFLFFKKERKLPEVQIQLMKL
jgi:hypothetical protein